MSYAFDILLEIYRECGWSDRDATKSILENNLHGLDIDDRAAQLACFAVAMKARKYNRRILNGETSLNIFAMQDSDFITEDIVRYFAGKDEKLRNDINELRITFNNAKEYGSIISVPKLDFAALYERIDIISRSFAEDIFQIGYQNTVIEQLLPLVKQAEILSKKYDVVATNPPYMNKYSPRLKDYINQHFADYKGDLFSVFMFRNFAFCKENGYSGFLTPNVWMSIKSYQALREYIMSQKNIVSLVQMAHGAFNEIACVDVSAFVLKNRYSSTPGVYIKLSEFKGGMDAQGEKCLYAIKNECDYKYFASNDELMLVPGSPITAYSATPKTLRIYKDAKLLESVAEPKQGLATADNNRFLRLWHEVEESRINFHCNSFSETETKDVKWYPYNKGGDYRKWYGNNDYVVNWQYNGAEIKSFADDKGKLRSRPQNTQFYFRECISWSLISSYSIAFRYKPKGFIFDIAGMSCFASSNIPLKYLLALNNSCLISKIMLMLAPTINYQSGNIANIPVIYDEEKSKEIIDLVDENILLAKNDWDAYETSWDFKSDPICNLRNKYHSISEAYEYLKSQVNHLYDKLRENEMALNKLMLDVYGLAGEISTAVSRRDVSHTFIYDTKEEITDDIRESYYVRTKSDIIRNFMQYAIGVIFGRYSLDVEGLAFAGGEWDGSKYKTIIPDVDNILPICDDDYFEDDLTGKFVKFVEVVYGKETLEENLRFVADALGGKGTAREVIRNYLLNGFYADHLKIYQKRPIYWQFSSGKKNGFKALVYMHRYQPDLLARMRTDYVHEQQERYRTQLTMLEESVDSAAPSEKVRINKQIAKLRDQSLEIQKFEEKVHHLADQMISIDLDDGVKVNYAKFQDVLEKIK